MHCAISCLCYDIVYFKSQVCVQMKPPRLQDKKPECFVGNATYFIKIQERKYLNKEGNPLQMILELWMPIFYEKRRK